MEPNIKLKQPEYLDDICKADIKSFHTNIFRLFYKNLTCREKIGNSIATKAKKSFVAYD